MEVVLPGLCRFPLCGLLAPALWLPGGCKAGTRPSFPCVFVLLKWISPISSKMLTGLQINTPNVFLTGREGEFGQVTCKGDPQETACPWVRAATWWSWLSITCVVSPLGVSCILTCLVMSTRGNAAFFPAQLLVMELGRMAAEALPLDCKCGRGPRDRPLPVLVDRQL